MADYPTRPKCGYESGDTWAQCEGSCPMPMSPHYVEPADQGRIPDPKLVREPGWRPYCLMCSTMGRMTRRPYGFECQGAGDYFSRGGCRNTIGEGLKRIVPRA